MKLQQKNLQSLLAARYVLGSMQGKARLRFEYYMQQQTELHQLVEQWRQRFMPLVELLPPIEPPANIWTTIQRRIGPLATQRNSSTGLWASLSFWRNTAVAAVAFSVAMVSMVIYQPASLGLFHVAELQTVTIFHDAQAKPTMVASLDMHKKELIIEMLKQPKAHNSVYQPKQVMQVWCLMGKGSAPMSVGIMGNEKRSRFKMSDKDIKMLKAAEGLAISMEPPGGSEKPTGKVMYTGKSI